MLGRFPLGVSLPAFHPKGLPIGSNSQSSVRGPVGTDLTVGDQDTLQRRSMRSDQHVKRTDRLALSFQVGSHVSVLLGRHIALTGQSQELIRAEGLTHQEPPPLRESCDSGARARPTASPAGRGCICGSGCRSWAPADPQRSARSHSRRSVPTCPFPCSCGAGRTRAGWTDCRGRCRP
jgi:hypothetical protein